jgi:hypothetical protein
LELEQNLNDFAVIEFGIKFCQEFNLKYSNELSNVNNRLKQLENGSVAKAKVQEKKAVLRQLKKYCDHYLVGKILI